MTVITRLVIGMLCAGFLQACTSLPDVNAQGNYSQPIGYSAVTDNPTLYTRSLSCLAKEYAAKPEIRIAVGRISDLTNTHSITDGGFVTDGATLMLISALAKSKVRQVERADMTVAKDELSFAMDKLLGHPRDKTFKKLISGQVRSADYFIVGGITEMNFNIRSNKGELKIPEVGLGVRYAVMNVALDLRLVNTETLEIHNVISRQKQIIGKEIKAGFFDFIGSTFTVALFDGKRAEPVQLGVRTVIERAVIDLISPLYEVDPGPCLALARSGHQA